MWDSSTVYTILHIFTVSHVHAVFVSFVYSVLLKTVFSGAEPCQVWKSYPMKMMENVRTVSLVG